MSVDTGDWSAGSAIDCTYQWQRCDGPADCHAIPDATEPSYEVTGADVGATIRAAVTAAAAGAHATARSDRTTPVRGRGAVLGLSLDDGRGDVAADATGSGRNGSVVGATWVAGGRLGGALSFDGDGDQVSIDAASPLDAADQLTVETWLRPRTSSLSASKLISKPAVGGPGWALELSDLGALQVRLGDQRLAGPQLPAGRWTHRAFSYDGSELRVYVDAQLVASAAAAQGSTATGVPIMVAGNGPFGPGGFDGML